MTWITVYREDRQLRGKELAANTLASFLVAQGCASLLDLSETWVMNHDLLAFINRSRAIENWVSLGRLSFRGGGLVLTRTGLDVILNREAGEALAATGKKNAYNVSPELVRLARRFILTGRRAQPLEVEVSHMRLDLDIPGGNWSVD
jgi:hypothetical protein